MSLHGLIIIHSLESNFHDEIIFYATKNFVSLLLRPAARNAPMEPCMHTLHRRNAFCHTYFTNVFIHE